LVDQSYLSIRGKLLSILQEAVLLRALLLKRC
jgi:hypothetical protein